MKQENEERRRKERRGKVERWIVHQEYDM